MFCAVDEMQFISLTKADTVDLCSYRTIKFNKTAMHKISHKTKQQTDLILLASGSDLNALNISGLPKCLRASFDRRIAHLCRLKQHLPDLK